MYALSFFVAAILAWISQSDYSTTLLRRVSSEYYSYSCESGVECLNVLTVFRIVFAMGLMHLVLSILLINVRSSKDKRAIAHNGLWGIKTLFVVAVAALSLKIPNGFFTILSRYFYTTGAVAFILVQIVLLIDFSYTAAGYLLERWEDTNDRRFLGILLTISLLTYAFSFIVTAYLYSWFGGGSCPLNQFFITFNIILAVLVSALSIHPKIQEVNARSGLAQSSVITLYTTYLIVSAFLNHKSEGEICYPSFSVEKSGSVSALTGSLLTFLVISYSTTRTASKCLNLSETEYLPVSDTGADTSDGNQELNDDEADQVSYSYSIFHFVFFLGFLNLAMVITNWPSLIVEDHLIKFVTTSSTMWVKVVSSWAVIIMYGWTLVAPLVFPDRDFGI